ncbi:hypothetical protein FAM09_18565 [Niastella caeni]|uniref:Glycosyltransferase RgtA/B/C/D-like domain-containing protein n=1 Tax=Niastella caeni TaxID=2569763 RepID=A0A4S8HSK9_9BACT|nr:hypothetical protein [Niastella caeni]THU36964.1 hypothetical protein FAM09_18565 [Niastella caeni]
MTDKTGFNKLTGGLFVIGALVGLYFQFAYHKFLNNDTLSYINIAERYAEGDWQHAINGFWSPMYCWILCLCKLAGLPLLQSCYVINFIVAGLGLYILCSLARRYLTQPLFYLFFSLYALLLMLFYAMSSLTPDLMSAVFCVWFLLLVTDQRFAFNKQIPILAGIAAACAYFSKLYNFVPVNLFLAGLLLWAFFKNKSSRSKQIKPILRTYGVFILFAAIWTTILSVHENKLVITTAGQFNHNFVSPHYKRGYPTNVGLYAPPYEKAYSAHTDPGHMLDDYGWSPFSDTGSFLHQVSLIKNSIRELIFNLDATGAKWLILFTAGLILFINRKKIMPTYDRSIYQIAWFFVCYPLLYLPLFILDRYILTCIILFHLLLFVIAQLAWRFINRKIYVPVIALLLVVSVVPFVLSGQRKLIRSSSEYRYYKSFYQHLPQLSFLKDQPIASDRWSMVQATQLCYHLKCRYYSTWADDQYNSLKQYNIRYLVSQKDLTSFSFLQVKEKLLLEKEPLYIYEIQ